MQINYLLVDVKQGPRIYFVRITQHMQLSSVSALPRIDAPAHEWQTLPTVLKQAQDIATKVTDLVHKTVTPLDMGLMILG